MADDEITPDPWAVGTPITVDHPLHAMIEGWRVAEALFVEVGFPQATAERNAKALFARLAALDPPVLVCHPSEMRDA